MQQAKAQFLSLFLFILGFLLFWEWLRPLAVITNTEHVNDFVGFAVFSFLLTYLRLPFWLAFPLKFIAIFFVLHLLFFYNTPLFDRLWLDYFVDDIHKNLAFISQGNWVDFTDLFKSFLFFILLWIVSYLMRYWLLQTRRLFLFFFVTVIYLTILDTFTLYHADFAIVRTMIIGLILMGILRLLKIQESEKVTFEKGRLPLAWLVPLLALIVLTAIVGFVAPKLGPQWPDPVPFIQKAANGYPEYEKGQGNGTGPQTIGYDDDDTHLGGSFLMDDTPVFYTEGEYNHYWRIGSKNVYTGKGWVNRPQGQVQTVDADHLDRSPVLDLYEQNTKVSSATDKVETLSNNFPQLIYGGEVNAIEGKSRNRVSLQLNDSTGKLEPMYHGRHVTLRKYTINYQYPSFSINRLSEVIGNQGDPKEIKQQDLQLPAELPNRVRKLAIKLTKNESNRYDKVQALLNYLQSDTFTYQIDGVPRPSGQTDYVDQFLFETHFGYCDNFSTAMTVLLRAAGIPARWVKGFTQGTYDKAVDLTHYKYVVKNSDAHSWVEVYFPNSGWVPFEPTKSFDNPYSFNYDTNASDSEAAPANAQDDSANQEQQQQQKEKAQKKQQQQPAAQKEQASQHTSGTKAKGENAIPWIVSGVILFILLIAAVILYRMRKSWWPKYLLHRFRQRTDEAAFDVAFKHLLKLLAMHGYTIKSDQTLREFAVKVDRELGVKEMSRLVKYYEEKHYYHASGQHWSECKESWENIIKKISG
ncbi:hypothetical protein GCM10011391_13210 [Pullulanibacillus camelliae]|uniref:Transglutaminase-like domain-containing protein n=1 Tax=Pullulanibacillus camelliae TaxID=1707096 RepID=A0A8J2VQP8_9BACL|nr:hypothetical protein GCM10011391_13210 [Pullulanibacillus camelliae]